MRRAQGASRRARLEHADRHALAKLARDHAAVGLHDPQGGVDPHLAQTAFDRPQVAAHHRHHISVEHGGHRALVLAHLAQHLAGQRHRHVGRQALRDRLDPLLVGRVGETVQKAHRDRAHAGVQQRAHRALDAGVGGFGDDRAGGIDPLVDLDAQLTRDDRIRSGRSEVVEVIAQLAGDLDHIAKAGGGDQTGARALALDHQVGDRGGRTGHHRLDLRHVDAVLGQQALQTGADRRHHIDRVAEHLAGQHRRVAAQQHQIGEGAADVEGESVAHRIVRGRDRLRHSLTLASLIPRSNPLANLPSSKTPSGIWK